MGSVREMQKEKEGLTDSNRKRVKVDVMPRQVSLFSFPGCYISSVWHDMKEMEGLLCKHDLWPPFIQYSIRMTVGLPLPLKPAALIGEFPLGLLRQELRQVTVDGEGRDWGLPCLTAWQTAKYNAPEGWLWDEEPSAGANSSEMTGCSCKSSVRVFLQRG